MYLEHHQPMCGLPSKGSTDRVYVKRVLWILDSSLTNRPDHMLEAQRDVVNNTAVALSDGDAHVEVEAGSDLYFLLLQKR